MGATTTDVTAREIRAMLQQRLPELLGRLFPRHAITVPIFTPLNPTRADRKPGSFVIWTSGAAAGGFNEYSPAGPPASGDVIDLLAYVHGRAGDRKFALAFARDFLGLRQMDAGARRAAVRQARDHASVVSAQQSAAAAGKIARASKLWTKTLPIAGSCAETYLASRRIPLALVANREDDLRFLPVLEFWTLAAWDRQPTPWRKLKDGPTFPAMVAAMRNLAGDLTAVHCTFLRRDGSGKADVGPGVQAKLMRGVAKGSAIWLTRGAGGASVAEAMAAGEVSPLILAEGIENGLSDALACPEARVAACGSFDLMLALDVSAPIFDPLIYSLDNDDNPEAADAVADHIDMLAARGRRASVMRPPPGVKDFNDLLKAGA